MGVDAVIAGGGVMGCSIAYHLLVRRPGARVVVVERDPTYEFASTVRSDGNVRVQFNLDENILMSKYAMEKFATFADDMAVGDVRPQPSARKQGNVFLSDLEGEPAARAGMARQRALGCAVEWMTPDEIAAGWDPYVTSGVVGGTFGPEDGSVDPDVVLHGFRLKAVSLGAEFVQGEASEVLTAPGRVTGLRLSGGEEIAAPVVVNAAGAWAAGLARTAGVEIPVQPVMRTVYVVDTDQHAAATLPSIFVPSGLYVIHERAGTYLVAWSLPDDPVGYDFTFRRGRFDDVIWPELVKWLPRFERLRVTGGWTGLYAVNTLDGNAILGEWPLLRGFYLANGFSGHGFQHAHAVGRYLAEVICGDEPELDLFRLGPQRVIDGVPLFEHTGRII